MPATHALSEPFMQALSSESGVLHPILKALQLDDTLLLGLRNGYISIYYRGGELLTIEGLGDGPFRAFFNRDYDTTGILPARLQRHGSADVLERPLASAGDATALVDVFDELKGLMDRHAKIRQGHEREFQQLAARVNNRTRSSNASNYFITDIEHAEDSARFDMLGVYRHERKQRDRLVPVIFEMKYGESALGGPAGLVKHLSDVLELVADSARRAALCENVEAQFEQLSKLGLLQYNREKVEKKFNVAGDHVKIVFVLAEYSPRSSHLSKWFDELDRLMREYEPKIRLQGLAVDLRFATASLCGYAMHEATMLTTAQVRTLMHAWQPVTEAAEAAQPA